MNFINKINKYLLEHYPLVWNTRLVWMLGIGFLSHILFFLLGYNTIQNIADLKAEYNLSNFYSDTSIVYYNVLFSIFIMLVWILFYLRNNAFKNHYALKKGMLFTQFCFIIVIILINITQFYSFKKGVIVKVSTLYDWKEIDKDIKSFNTSALFLVQDYNWYEINKKKYPAPFPLRIAVENANHSIKEIDTSKNYITYNGFNFQFYKFNQELWDKEHQSLNKYGRYEEDNFKYRIVKDVSKYKELIHPSLLNYSRTLYNYGQDSVAYKKQLLFFEDILKKGDKKVIESELSKFIDLANKYEVKHNLTLKNWLPLVYHTPNYFLKELIHVEDPNDKTRENYYPHELVKKAVDSDMGYIADIPYSKTLYCNLYRLDNFFKNVHEAHFHSFNIEILYFFIAFTFCLGLILFIFKTTSLKSILLSVVASILILVIIVMLMSYAHTIGMSFGITRYIESLILIVISFLVISFAVISYLKYWKKIITTIAFSLGIFAVPMLLLSLVMFYDRYTKEKNIEVEYYRNEFMVWFEADGFWGIIFLWTIAIAVYCSYIKRLKVRPS